MGALLCARARISLSFCLPFLPPLSSFPTSLAATLRSAATNARPQHQLQQRIISVVINGDALGNCYRAARSFPLHTPHRPVIASSISSPLAVQISSSYSLSRHPFSVPLFLFHTYTHSFCSSSTRFILFSPATSSRYETAFQASLNLAPRLPKVRETRA